MDLRPYQQEAREAIFEQWDSGVKKTLLVLPTGDVYKRQVYDRRHSDRSGMPYTGNYGTVGSRTETVSYTHLDVYKRQLWNIIIR